MEDNEMMTLWRSYDKKLEETLVLHRHNAMEITRLRVQSLLASMRPVKIFTLVVGLLWVGFVDMLILNLWSVASPFFLVSAAIQVLLTKLAIGIYVYQLILLHEVDISEPVLSAQERIARLQSSTLWVTRILFLQLPVWTTFYWNESMLEDWTVIQFVIQAICTLAFTLVAVWLFLNIKVENRNKKWFRLIFNGQEWSPVMKSMELLEQIETYRRGK